MSKKVGLIVVVGLMSMMAPSFADDDCIAPAMPAPVNGATASQSQIWVAMGAVSDFIASSNIYQTCLSEYVDAQKADAAKNNISFDPAIEKAAMAKVAGNRGLQRKAGEQLNAAIAEYKRANAN